MPFSHGFLHAIFSLSDMNKTLFAFLLAALALGTVPGAHAQTVSDALRFSERSVATGARMMGLAGAGTAGLADPSALFSNPAGLGFYRHSEVSGALGFSNVGDRASYLVGGAGSDFEADLQNTRLDHFAYVARAPVARGSLVFGAAYQQTHLFDRDLSFRNETNQTSISSSYLPYSDEYEVDGNGDLNFFNDTPLLGYNAGLIEYAPTNNPAENQFIEAVLPGTTIEQRGQVLEQGIMQEVSVGGAVEGARNVMFGLSANLSFGRYRFDRRFEELDVNGENGPDDYFITVGNTEYAGFDALTVRDEIRSDLFGINLRGGFSARVAQMPLHVGLTVETPTYYNINEDYRTEVETVFDQGGSLAYGGRADEPGFGTYEYQITTPWRLGAGVAYVGAPLTISADFETLNWQEMRFDSNDLDGTFVDQNDEIRAGLRRVLNSRVGAEYSLGSVVLRAGYAYQPDPRKQDDVFDTNTDTVDRSRTTVSLGAGVRLARGTFVDLGWMHTQFDDAYTPYGDVAVVPNVREEVSRDRFSLGLRVAF